MSSLAKRAEELRRKGLLGSARPEETKLVEARENRKTAVPLFMQRPPLPPSRNVADEDAKIRKFLEALSTPEILNNIKSDNEYVVLGIQQLLSIGNRVITDWVDLSSDMKRALIIQGIFNGKRKVALASNRFIMNVFSQLSPQLRDKFTLEYLAQDELTYYEFYKIWSKDYKEQIKEQTSIFKASLSFVNFFELRMKSILEHISDEFFILKDALNRGVSSRAPPKIQFSSRRYIDFSGQRARAYKENERVVSEFDKALAKQKKVQPIIPTSKGNTLEIGRGEVVPVKYAEKRNMDYLSRTRPEQRDVYQFNSDLFEIISQMRQKKILNRVREILAPYFLEARDLGIAAPSSPMWGGSSKREGWVDYEEQFENVIKNAEGLFDFYHFISKIVEAEYRLFSMLNRADYTDLLNFAYSNSVRDSYKLIALKETEKTEAELSELSVDRLRVLILKSRLVSRPKFFRKSASKLYDMLILHEITIKAHMEKMGEEYIPPTPEQFYKMHNLIYRINILSNNKYSYADLVGLGGASHDEKRVSYKEVGRDRKNVVSVIEYLEKLMSEYEDERAILIDQILNNRVASTGNQHYFNLYLLASQVEPSKGKLSNFIPTDIKNITEWNEKLKNNRNEIINILRMFERENLESLPIEKLYAKALEVRDYKKLQPLPFHNIFNVESIRSILLRKFQNDEVIMKYLEIPMTTEKSKGVGRKTAQYRIDSDEKHEDQIKTIRKVKAMALRDELTITMIANMLDFSTEKVKTYLDSNEKASDYSLPPSKQKSLLDGYVEAEIIQREQASAPVDKLVNRPILPQYVIQGGGTRQLVRLDVPKDEIKMIEYLPINDRVKEIGIVYLQRAISELRRKWEKSTKANLLEPIYLKDYVTAIVEKYSENQQYTRSLFEFIGKLITFTIFRIDKVNDTFMLNVVFNRNVTFILNVLNGGYSIDLLDTHLQEQYAGLSAEDLVYVNDNVEIYIESMCGLYNFYRPERKYVDAEGKTVIVQGTQFAIAGIHGFLETKKNAGKATIRDLSAWGDGITKVVEVNPFDIVFVEELEKGASPLSKGAGKEGVVIHPLIPDLFNLGFMYEEYKKNVKECQKVRDEADIAYIEEVKDLEELRRNGYVLWNETESNDKLDRAERIALETVAEFKNTSEENKRLLVEQIRRGFQERRERIAKMIEDYRRYREIAAVSYMNPSLFELVRQGLKEIAGITINIVQHVEESPPPPKSSSPPPPPKSSSPESKEELYEESKKEESKEESSKEESSKEESSKEESSKEESSKEESSKEESSPPKSSSPKPKKKRSSKRSSPQEEKISSPEECKTRQCCYKKCQKQIEGQGLKSIVAADDGITELTFCSVKCMNDFPFKKPSSPKHGGSTSSSTMPDNGVELLKQAIKQKKTLFIRKAIKHFLSEKNMDADTVKYLENLSKSDATALKVLDPELYKILAQHGAPNIGEDSRPELPSGEIKDHLKYFKEAIKKKDNEAIERVVKDAIAVYKGKSVSGTEAATKQKLFIDMLKAAIEANLSSKIIGLIVNGNINVTLIKKKDKTAIEKIIATSTISDDSKEIINTLFEDIEE